MQKNGLKKNNTLTFKEQASYSVAQSVKTDVRRIAEGAGLTASWVVDTLLTEFVENDAFRAEILEKIRRQRK